MEGWILAPGRRTITNIIRAAGGAQKKNYSNFHRFFSRARWDLDEVCRILVQKIINPILPDGEITIAGDDTTCHKTGEKIAYAGIYRDAVRSSKKKAILHWAHNWVILGIVVQVPFFSDWKICLPVLFRLYRKQEDCDSEHPFKTRQQLLLEMVELLVNWLPERKFRLLIDGGFVSNELIPFLPKNVIVIGRIRCDAALYEQVKERSPRKRGRPRKKGARLPSLREISKQNKREWKQIKIIIDGKEVIREITKIVAIWYKIIKDNPVAIVIIRDPKGKARAEYLFTTNVSLTAEDIVFSYQYRWPIEEAIREGKQYLGFEDSQAYVKNSVLRQAPLALILLSIIKVVYIQYLKTSNKDIIIETDPWNPNKARASFLDILAEFRRELWLTNIFCISQFNHKDRKIISHLINIISKAA